VPQRRHKKDSVHAAEQRMIATETRNSQRMLNKKSLCVNLCLSGGIKRTVPCCGAANDCHRNTELAEDVKLKYLWQSVPQRRHKKDSVHAAEQRMIATETRNSQRMLNYNICVNLCLSGGIKRTVPCCGAANDCHRNTELAEDVKL